MLLRPRRLLQRQTLRPAQEACLLRCQPAALQAALARQPAALALQPAATLPQQAQLPPAHQPRERAPEAAGAPEGAECTAGLESPELLQGAYLLGVEVWGLGGAAKEEEGDGSGLVGSFVVAGGLLAGQAAGGLDLLLELLQLLELQGGQLLVLLPPAVALPLVCGRVLRRHVLLRQLQELVLLQLLLRLRHPLRQRRHVLLRPAAYLPHVHVVRPAIQLAHRVLPAKEGGVRAERGCVRLIIEQAPELRGAYNNGG